MTNINYMELVPEGCERRWAVCDANTGLPIEWAKKGNDLKELFEKYKNRDDVMFAPDWVPIDKE